MAALWTRLLHWGDVAGKLITLFTLPTALIAGFLYLGEIRDFLSRPDLTVNTITASLRCTVEVTGRNEGESTLDYQNRLCGAGNLSAWLTFTLANNDSISRTIGQWRLRLDASAVEDWPVETVQLTQARLVNEELRNDRRVVTLSTMQPITLAPGQQVQFDVDFRAFLTEDQVPFLPFRQLITDQPDALADRPIDLLLDIKPVGADSWLPAVGTCRLIYPRDTLDRAAKKPVLRALTRRCQPVP